MSPNTWLHARHTPLRYFMFSRVPNAVASAKEQGKVSAVSSCRHGAAALSVQAQNPTSLVIAEDELLAMANAAMDMGVLGSDTVLTIMSMYRKAGAVGVALVAKLGGTGYHVVRENSNRSFPGGWAHVFYDDESSVSRASRRRRRKEHPQLMCKVKLTIAWWNRLWLIVLAYLAAWFHDTFVSYAHTSL